MGSSRRSDFECDSNWFFNPTRGKERSVTASRIKCAIIIAVMLAASLSVTPLQHLSPTGGENNATGSSPGWIPAIGANTPAKLPVSNQPNVPATSVKQTLFLLNNTLEAGNLIGGNGLTPADVLYVPSAGAVYISESASSFVTVLNATTLSQVAFIRVGNQPSEMAFDPENGCIYVANAMSSNVSVINTTTNKVVASIMVGSGDYYISYIPGDGNIFVSDEYANIVSVINPATNTILLNIAVGSYPTAIMYDPFTQHVYVVDYGSSNISAINMTYYYVDYSISLPNYPFDAVYAPANGNIYFTAVTPELVSVLNVTSRTVVANMTVGLDPAYIAYDPASGTVYVANSNSNNISVIDTSTNTVSASVNVGVNPAGMAVDAASGSLLIAESASNNISVVNTSTNQLTGSVRVGMTPVAVAFDVTNGQVYVANTITNNVSVVNASTGKAVSSVYVGGTPAGIACDPADSTIYVTNSGNSNVSVIDGSTNKVVATVPVGYEPHGIVFDPANGNIYVANVYSDDISVINTTTNTVTATIATGNYTVGLAYDPANGYIYASGQAIFGHGAVWAINTSSNAIVSMVNVGYGPGGMAYDPVSGYLYVANAGGYNVSVVNTVTNTVDRTVNVSSNPLSIVYDPADACVYAVNEYTGNISVIYTGTNSVVASVSVGNQPEALAYDSTSNYVYCANYGSGTLSTITSGTIQGYSVNVTESGLPAGTEWSAMVAGVDHSSNTQYISFYEFNGTYNYSVQSAGNYTASPSSGTLSVNGPGATLNVTFAIQVVYNATYQVTLVENGLPAGTSWYVNLSNGQNITVSASASTVVQEQNGTYGYIASSSNTSWTCPPGNFVVNGSAMTVQLYFATNEYTVTMTENGLPAGTVWYFNVTGGISVASGSSSASLQEQNGTYGYTVSSSDRTYAPSQASGTFTVNGLNITLTDSFVEVTYSVAFTESGLPSGIAWFVNITGGGSFSSSTSTISFAEPNGTYSYIIGTADNAYAANGGSFAVNGASVSAAAQFNPVTYSVRVSETGLPSGTEWWWNISGGSSFFSSGTSIQTSFSNGTYSFTASSANSQYSPSQPSGTFAVSGSPISLSVAFSSVAGGPPYATTFTEAGLPAGSEWFVNLTNGQSFSSTTSNIAFSEPNGSYRYIIGTNNTEFEAAGGVFNVTGAPATVAVYFSEVTYAVTFAETGLQAGTSWSATLNGVNKSSTSSTIVFAEPNGTYSYTIGQIGGYNESTTSGTLAVHGSSVSEPVSFTQQTGTQTHKNQTATGGGLLPVGDMLYLLTGIVLVVAVAGVAIALSRRKKS